MVTPSRARVRAREKARDLAGARLVEGHARDEDARALEGCAGVISALGTAMSPFREVTLLSTATRALAQATTPQAAHPLVCITGEANGSASAAWVGPCTPASTIRCRAARF